MSAPFQLFDALPAHIEDALRASIERFGVLVPVVKDQHGNTIDGHHRSRIADKLGVKYRVDVVRIADEDEAREIARTLNSDRRQLTEDQRREVVRVLREQGHSVRAIAGALGVSVGTAHNDIAEVFSDEQLEQPERVRGLDGKSRPAKRPTVVAAKNEREAERAQDALAVVGDEPLGIVLDVKRIERIARETAAELRRTEQVESVTVEGLVDIRHGDFREVLADIEPGTVDAIITDPPYPAEYIPLFGDLSELAAHILAPHGVLVAMTGQSWLRQYLEELDKHLDYRWTAAYIAQGARTRMHAAKVGTGWKPLLVYRRRDADDLPFLNDDLFDSSTTADANAGRLHHHWGQAAPGIAEQVERFTQPGQLVVDPFLGGGTTAVVCRDLGRRFIGCDIDAAHVSTSRERAA